MLLAMYADLGEAPAFEGLVSESTCVHQGKEITTASGVQQSVEQSFEGKPLNVHVVRGQEHLELSMLVKWSVPY